MNLRFEQYLFLLCLWSLMIFVLLTAPMPVNETGQISYLDKVVHFFLFGIFSFLFSLFLLKYRRKIQLKRIIFSAFVAASFYALVMEILQFFIKSRTSSQYDLIFGVLGALFFQVLFYAGKKRKK